MKLCSDFDKIADEPALVDKNSHNVIMWFLIDIIFIFQKCSILLMIDGLFIDKIRWSTNFEKFSLIIRFGIVIMVI